MRRNSIIYGVTIAILLIAGLFFLTNRDVSKKVKTHDNSAEMDMEGTQMGSTMSNIEPANFDSILQAAILKISPSDKEKLANLQKALSEVEEVQLKSDLNEEIALFWLKKNRRVAAHYFLQSGQLDDSEKKLNYASHLYLEELHHEQDPALRSWMSNDAIKAFQRSLEVNPNNDTVRIDYALLYIDVLNQPMAGIQELLSIVEKDPNNIPANIILGKMAVESGQLDKAIERGELVLRLEPDNLEGHLFLGEAYKRHNELDKAIELFTAAKKILNHPEFTKDIDDYIESFKQ